VKMGKQENGEVDKGSEKASETHLQMTMSEMQMQESDNEDDDDDDDFDGSSVVGSKQKQGMHISNACYRRRKSHVPPSHEITNNLPGTKMTPVLMVHHLYAEILHFLLIFTL
jgi:hypothetical protein